MTKRRRPPGHFNAPARNNFFQGHSRFGVLVSFDLPRQRSASREIVAALEKAALEVYPNLAQNEVVGGGDPADSATSTAAALSAELKELRKKEGQETLAKFQVQEVNANSLFFVNFRDAGLDPERIVSTILRNARAAPNQCGLRHCMRIIPVEVTSYAGIKEAEKAAKELVARKLPEGATESYGVVFKARNNSSAKREEFIDTLAAAVPTSHKVNLSCPDMTFIVEIVQTVCFMSIVKDYDALGKFNVRTVIEETIKAQEKAAGKGEREQREGNEDNKESSGTGNKSATDCANDKDENSADADKDSKTQSRAGAENDRDAKSMAVKDDHHKQDRPVDEEKNSRANKSSGLQSEEDGAEGDTPAANNAVIEPLENADAPPPTQTTATRSPEELTKASEDSKDETGQSSPSSKRQKIN